MSKKVGSIIIALSLFFVFAIPCFTSAQSVDDISIMTENYPPFNFEQDKKLQGIAVDLMVSMLAKLDSKQSRESIRLLPWARGYQSLLKKQNTCLFATTRTEERESKFKWVGPISPTTIVLTAKKEKKITINSVDDIKKYKVGAVINDIGEQLLVNSGLTLEQLDRIGGKNVLDLSIKKLNASRIDLFAYEENVVKWEIKKRGFNPDDFVAVYTLKKAELYYAFHIDTSDSLIQKFQTALDEVKMDGTYQTILDIYLK